MTPVVVQYPAISPDQSDVSRIIASDNAVVFGEEPIIYNDTAGITIVNSVVDDDDLEAVKGLALDHYGVPDYDRMTTDDKMKVHTHIGESLMAVLIESVNNAIATRGLSEESTIYVMTNYNPLHHVFLRLSKFTTGDQHGMFEYLKTVHPSTLSFEKLPGLNEDDYPQSSYVDQYEVWRNW